MAQNPGLDLLIPKIKKPTKATPVPVDGHIKLSGNTVIRRGNGTFKKRINKNIRRNHQRLRLCVERVKPLHATDPTQMNTRVVEDCILGMRSAGLWQYPPTRTSAC